MRKTVAPNEVSSVDSSNATVSKSVAAPWRSREVVAIVVWTLTADWLIFRTLGFTGPAVFFAIVPLVFLARKAGKLNNAVVAILVGLLWCVSLRLVWAGSGLNIFSGILLMIALAMAASGVVPLVLEGLAYLSHVWLDGMLAIAGQGVGARKHLLGETWSPADASEGESNLSGNTTVRREPFAVSLAWFMPLVAGIVFGGIFVFANPDLLSGVWGWVTRVMDFAWSWIEQLSIWELPFCVAALFVGAGLLRPVLLVARFGPMDEVDVSREKSPSPLYAPFRNTLFTLIVLFSVYLLFEFGTLWGREFPDGFYYAGYAHQGAAWLTFALALATGLLSYVFSGAVLSDERLIGLRKLAWIWSAQNFLLAMAVYNRLMIYVGYNGMTRMRTIAFFGITLVVIGFLLVLIKIRNGRGFWWLIQSQLIALVLIVIAYGLFPVDWVAHRYNVARIASGHLHPSVMIAVKPLQDEGMLPLLGLVDAQDEIIREGVRALLARRQRKIEFDSGAVAWHWTKYQGSTNSLYKRLKESESKWEHYWKSPKARNEAIERYRDYAMQWY